MKPDEFIKEVEDLKWWQFGKACELLMTPIDTTKIVNKAIISKSLVNTNDFNR